MLKPNESNQVNYRLTNRYQVNLNIIILDDIKLPDHIYDIALLQKGNDMPSEVLNYLLTNNEQYKHFFNRTSNKKAIVIDAYPKELENKNVIYFKMTLTHEVHLKADNRDDARLQALTDYEKSDIYSSIQLIKKPGTDVDISVEFESEKADKIFCGEVGY